jgi:hypothetical protein
MIVYAFTGTLIDVSGEIGWFMPGLGVGMPVCGTISVAPHPSNPNIKTAALYLTADDHLVKAESVGVDPLKSFADHVPTGPLASPTVQHGYIDNAFFKFALDGASIGTTGFTVQGPGPDGSSKAGAATGRVQSLIVLAS